MTGNTTASNDDEQSADPSQIFPPYSDTRPKMGSLPYSLLVVYLMAGVLYIGIALLWIAGFGPYSIAGAFIVTAVVYAARWVCEHTDWHGRPVEQLGKWIERRRLQRSTPWTIRQNTIDSIHDVRDIYDDGTVEWMDGSVWTLERIPGVNTYGQGEAGDRELSGEFADALDSHIYGRDEPEWGLYSTTFDIDPDEIPDEIEAATFTEHMRGRAKTLAREKVYRLAEFLRGPDHQSRQPRDWRHYSVTQATPDDTTPPTTSRRSGGGGKNARRGTKRGTGRLWSVRDFLTSPWKAATEHAATRRQERHDALVSRLYGDGNALGTSGALNTISGVETEPVGATETAMVLLDYYTGDRHEHQLRGEESPLLDDMLTHHEGSALTGRDSGKAPAGKSLEGGWNRIGADDSKRDGGGSEYDVLSPTITDITDDIVRFGQQYRRTYWISTFVTDPRPLIFRDLFSMADTNLKVRLRMKPLDDGFAERTLEKLSTEVKVSSRGEEGERELEAQAVREDSEYYTQAFKTIRDNEDVHGWELSGYIMVCAGRRAAIEEIRSSRRDYHRLEAATLKVLEDRCESVREVVEGSPANCHLSTDELRHVDLVKSCAPVGPDAFANATDKQPRIHRVAGSPKNNPRTQYAMGGSLGTLFPACTGVLQEENGEIWGRNVQNERLMRPNIFRRGSSGHGAAVAKTRGGKTVWVKWVLDQWLPKDPSNIAVLFDTKGEFYETVQTHGGSVHTVGADLNYNPLAIEPIPTRYRKSLLGDGIRPRQQKVSGVANFLTSIAAANGAPNGGRMFRPQIKKAVRMSYDNAGILEGEINTHGRENPPLDTVFTNLKTLLNDESAADGHSGQHYDSLWAADEVAAKRESKISELAGYLEDFAPGGEYESLRHATGSGVIDAANGEGQVIYIDGRNIADADERDKSAQMGDILGNVTQMVRVHDGRVIAGADEAHELLQSADQRRWLAKAAREWAAYNSALIYLSQSPREFLQRAVGVGEGQENVRATIIEQLSWLAVGHSPRVPVELLKRLGMNETTANQVDQLTPGEAGLGYSEFLFRFDNRKGWWKTRVRLDEFNRDILSYHPDDGDLAEYLDRHGHHKVAEDYRTARRVTDYDADPIPAADSSK